RRYRSNERKGSLQRRPCDEPVPDSPRCRANPVAHGHDHASPLAHTNDIAASDLQLSSADAAAVDPCSMPAFEIANDVAIAVALDLRVLPRCRARRSIEKPHGARRASPETCGTLRERKKIGSGAHSLRAGAVRGL